MHDRINDNPVSHDSNISHAKLRKIMHFVSCGCVSRDAAKNHSYSCHSTGTNYYTLSASCVSASGIFKSSDYDDWHCITWLKSRIEPMEPSTYWVIGLVAIFLINLRAEGIGGALIESGLAWRIISILTLSLFSVFSIITHPPFYRLLSFRV